MCWTAHCLNSVASAAQPASTLKNSQILNMLLSKQSAKIGEFKVIVFMPWKDTFTYEWEGQRRETTAWRCLLVSAADPSLYCEGEFKLSAKTSPLIKEMRVPIRMEQLW